MVCSRQRHSGLPVYAAAVPASSVINSRAAMAVDRMRSVENCTAGMRVCVLHCKSCSALLGRLPPAAVVYAHKFIQVTEQQKSCTVLLESAGTPLDKKDSELSLAATTEEHKVSSLVRRHCLIALAVRTLLQQQACAAVPAVSGVAGLAQSSHSYILQAALPPTRLVHDKGIKAVIPL